MAFPSRYRLFHFRRKEEAEEKRAKAKKARMGFMKMLAQNTQIDGRSRWDEAERTLRDDARFKAVPDSSDREDLFNEFVDALTKKEKVSVVLVSELFRCHFVVSFLFYPSGGVAYLVAMDPRGTGPRNRRLPKSSARLFFFFSRAKRFIFVR